MGPGDGALSTPQWLRGIWTIPLAFLLLALVVPLVVLVVRTWSGDGSSILADATTWQIASLAAVQALLSTALSLAIGLPLAAVVSRYSFRGRAFAQALVTVPFVMPTVVVAMAFRTLLGSSLPQGFAIVVLAHAYVNLAVVVRIVGSRWVQHDGRYPQVARSLGASAFTVFRTVTLPFLRPSIISSAVVVFIFSFTSLGIIVLLGDSSTRTLESQILRRTSVLLDFPAAAALALLQLAMICVVIAIGAIASRQRGRQVPVRAAFLAMPRERGSRVLIRAIALAGVAIVLLPVLALLLASVRSSAGLTLQWWTALGSVDAGTTRLGSPFLSLMQSLRFALITGVVAAIIGGCAAVAVIAHRWGRAVAALAIIPLGISAATLGLGMLLAYGRPPLDLRATGLLIPLAHSLVAIPLVVAVMTPALRGVDPRAQEVAATLGARPTRAFLTAYGPTLSTVMLAAGGLACAVSLGEFGAASFLARTGAPTVPIQIVRLLSRPGEQSYGVAAVMSVILVALTLALVLGVDRLGRRSGAVRTTH
jgi:thiamine transport system permease protein